MHIEGVWPAVSNHVVLHVENYTTWRRCIRGVAIDESGGNPLLIASPEEPELTDVLVDRNFKGHILKDSTTDLKLFPDVKSRLRR